MHLEDTTLPIKKMFVFGNLATERFPTNNRVLLIVLMPLLLVLLVLKLELHI
jgi:hypothetical protein